MPMSNAMRDAVLNMVLEGLDPPWRAGVTGYLALIAGLTIDLDNPMANECTYTGYSRLPGTKSTVFAGSGVSRTNAGLLQWGKRTDAGAVQSAKYVAWVDTPSGAIGSLALIGQLDIIIDITQNTRPQAEAGSIIWTAT